LPLYAVFQATGITLPHSVGMESYGFRNGAVVTPTRVTDSQLQPGDLIFFGGSFSNWDHVPLAEMAIAGRTLPNGYDNHSGATPRTFGGRGSPWAASSGGAGGVCWLRW
jgi:hypothetical protein